MLKDISLKPYNTFGIDIKASSFIEIESISGLLEVLPALRSNHFLVSGGGSNILFTKDFDGIFVRNKLMGIREIARTKDFVLIEAGAGVVWHDLVMNAVNQGLGGLENLSLIPGCVGASPMQNIGAYGVEIKDSFEYLDALEIETGTMHRFFKKDCAFGYRESIFKQGLKNKFIICSVAFRLTRDHQLNTSYGVIEAELAAMGITKPSIKAVSEAVVRIRQSKLPDPKVLGNAGSFFKNPVVPTRILEKIASQFEQVPSYPASDGFVKLAAGWLIEKAGWKGQRIGSTGVHDKQALVLVNHGGASGYDIFQLSERIIEDIDKKFGVQLEREVNIY